MTDPVITAKQPRGKGLRGRKAKRAKANRTGQRLEPVRIPSYTEGQDR